MAACPTLPRPHQLRPLLHCQHASCACAPACGHDCITLRKDGSLGVQCKPEV